LTFGPAYKVSRIQDFGDQPNDFAFGAALNATAGGLPTDCANALTIPNYTAVTCGYSLADTRTAVDYIFQADYTQNFGKHTVAAGGSYDNTRVLKNYAVTLQPGNFLAGLAPYYPTVPVTDPVTVVDNAPNIGNTYQSYIEDSWRMSNLWGIDYGMRYDFFNVLSTQYDEGFGAFSPRFKLTRYWGTRASLYAYIGRFFEPFSLENVSPQAAYLLNLPISPTVAQFDLLPERDTFLEFGGHVPVGSGDLGFRVWQKNANDLIDDTQVGVTLLHQDINYTLGRLSQEALNYVHPLPNNGRWYVSAAHVISLNSGCETQLLAPCFGAPTGFTPADHEQRYTSAAGVLLNDTHGGWFSADGEYGSGLSTSLNPVGITCAGPGYTAVLGGPCKFTPHTTFNVEKGFAISPAAALTVGIQNILNDRYMVTYLNAQGNHFAPPRTFQVGVKFR
ncbi:MAG TPA: TonB-dependent receptor, partial [Candidatus Lustribacter sp.]|nr:TonB-dependent receptor [Candidatus Lustribacter sp.]